MGDVVGNPHSRSHSPKILASPIIAAQPCACVCEALFRLISPTTQGI